ncbi:MAG: hypothetical protein Q4G01_08090 [Eubacteriales bacterium]|nr:hypothetical protein [Eubacteriales bacterium]
MKNATQKWLAVAGCLILCVALVLIINSQFAKEPITDAPPPASSSQQSDVTVDKPDSSGTPQTEKEESGSAVKPELPSTDPTPSDDGASGGGAVSSGTEQTIQSDPVKPEYDEEVLKNPTQKPDGTPVEGKPEAQDHDSVEPPPPPPSTNTGGGLPGFDNVPNAGPNQVVEGKSDGDINKQVGIMD